MATTPVDPRVVSAMQASLSNTFGNPASVTHGFGTDAREQVELARAQVAELINAEPKEIIWTSGATEADNLAIKGVAHFYQHKGKHIITSQTEHKAVLDTCAQLAKQGFEITYLTPNADGLIAIEAIAAAIRDDTLLISLMHVNNEIGVIQDIAAVGKLAREKNILFHVDAAQSAGKVPLNVEAMNIDLLSLASHKVYGPKGIGALYVRRRPRVRLEAMIHGGGHEQGFRSGTLPTHQIVGMGQAFAIARDEMVQDQGHAQQLREHFMTRIQDLPKVTMNGSAQHRVLNNLNLCFHCVDGEALIMALPNLAVSTGSACNSATMDVSYVLRGIGLSTAEANSSLRISFGRFTTLDEIEQAASDIIDAVTRLRAMSPLWEDN
tara:strand:- start:18238 stop:19377 length:1140 start_codon:yes stop_codon:yes gene_type:complete